MHPAEDKAGEDLTLVMARCGLHRTAHALLGNMVRRIIDHGAGIVACVVDAVASCRAEFAKVLRSIARTIRSFPSAPWLRRPDRSLDRN